MSFYKEVPGRKTTLESTLKFDTAPTAGSTNPVTSGGVAEAVGGASEVLQLQIDDIAERAGSGYIPKGPATVATLNGLTGQENGELYTMTDAGTLTDGTLAVVAGDTVAWDATNNVWYKAMDYAPRQYGTNEVHNLPTSITAFRTGDVIPVDGPSGTAKMNKDSLFAETTLAASKTLELKSDINSKLLPVGNLFLAYYAGKYPSVQGGKTVLVNNEGYGTVVLSVPDGVQDVSFNFVGSMNFARLADKDGNDLGKYSDYVVSGSNNLQAVLPSGCKYVYTASGSWASTEPDIVCLPVDYSIQGQTTDAWPKFTLKQLIANKLYSESEKDLYENLIGKKANYEKTTDNYKNEVRNLSTWTGTHAGTPELKRKSPHSGTAIFSASYDGFTIGSFNATSSAAKILFKGKQTNGCEFDVTLMVYEANNTQHSHRLTTVDTEIFDLIITFDAASYSVYENADHFDILVSQTTGSNTIDIELFSVIDSDYLQIYDEWNNDLRPMLANICNKLENAPTPDIPSFNGIIAGGNGSNYKLQVNHSGTLVNIPCVPNKVLFMGNSLLLGIDTNGIHGGAFGMCATSPYKDYAYHVEQAILEKNPSATFTKLHDAAFEQAESDAAAEQYWTDNEASFTSDLDLIIMQIGDNVNTATRQAVFADNFEPLLGKIFTACPNVRVMCVSAWYNASRSLETISNGAKKYGCDFVNITSLHTNANEAVQGQPITYYDGTTSTALDNWITHPGDAGMQAIADAIISAMKM